MIYTNTSKILNNLKFILCRTRRRLSRKLSPIFPVKFLLPWVTKWSEKLNRCHTSRAEQYQVTGTGWQLVCPSHTENQTLHFSFCQTVWEILARLFVFHQLSTDCMLWQSRPVRFTPILHWAQVWWLLGHASSKRSERQLVFCQYHQ